jgi:hypothetical protein
MRGVWLVVLLVGCSSSAAPDGSVSADAIASDAVPADVRAVGDAGVLVPHDSGGPLSCQETCDCPQGLACVSGECRTAGIGPVYCCSRPGCPTGEVCLGAGDLPSSCPAPVPDAGVRDSGAGSIGSSCELDSECDTTQGLSCWAQGEAPFLWDGYCTLEDCLPSCPAGSSCITFTGAAPVSGCMADCTADSDCRGDAYCFQIPNSTIQICFPDCRDDLFDCAPRDGTTFCSRASGRCEPTPSQSFSAQVGDSCADNRDCNIGQVCMGEEAWRLFGGMCTQVCSGLPEASPCEPGDICQPLAGIGLCFKACTGGACPSRPNAICDLLDPAWVQPACIPM